MFPKGKIRTYQITKYLMGEGESRLEVQTAVPAVTPVLNPEKTGGLGVQGELQADRSDDGLPSPLQAELQVVTGSDGRPSPGNPSETGRKDGSDSKNGRLHLLSNGDDSYELDPDEEARIAMREGA